MIKQQINVKATPFIKFFYGKQKPNLGMTEDILGNHQAYLRVLSSCSQY